MRARAAGKGNGRTLLLYVYLPIKLIVLVNYPNEHSRCAREGRKHALYNNSKNNDGGDAACELLACKWIAGKAGSGASREWCVVYLALLGTVCSNAQYIWLTVAADVLQGKLPNSIVMPLELIPASSSLTRTGTSMIPRASSRAYIVYCEKIQISSNNKSDKNGREGD